MIARIAIALLLLCATACASGPALHGEPMVETRLYFGMNIKNGGEVSEDQWREFVDRELTLQFADGLTVIEARGQYLQPTGASGHELVREKARVVVLVHDGRADKRIARVIARYKQLFDQHSVLRVDTPAGVDFYSP